MRNPKRIREFCDRLAYLWETNCPDWRFGQLVVNTIGRDPFYLEDGDALERIEAFFNDEKKV